MSFIVIVLCLSVQWFLTLTVPRNYPWSDIYLNWMRKHFFSITHDHRLFSFLFLVLPPVIIGSFIFTIIYHLFGHLGYSVLSLVLLWYCVDIMFLKQTSATQTSSSDLFLKSYQNIFAFLFWYFLFGPGGLIVYVVIAALSKHVIHQKYFVIAQGILDWIPVRLVGLSFALAGNFSVAFKEWMRTLFHGITDCQNQVVVLGKLAMSEEAGAGALIRRALIIWVVVMGLFALGGVIG